MLLLSVWLEQIEKMNQGFFTLTLKTRKVIKLQPVFESLAGVRSVACLDDKTYLIEATENEELTDLIASEVLKSGAGLVELTRSKNQLEDVFLRLTYGQSNSLGAQI